MPLLWVIQSEFCNTHYYAENYNDKAIEQWNNIDVISYTIPKDVRWTDTVNAVSTPTQS